MYLELHACSHCCTKINYVFLQILKEALQRENAIEWMNKDQEEYKSLMNNKIWPLSKLPQKNDGWL